MEGRDNRSHQLSIKTRHMPKRLKVYTKSFGVHPSDRPTPAQKSTTGGHLGFDSPILLLSPVETAFLSSASVDSEGGTLPAGFEFCFGTNGSKTLEEFLAFARARGITIIRDPRESRGEM